MPNTRSTQIFINLKDNAVSTGKAFRLSATSMLKE